MSPTAGFPRMASKPEPAARKTSGNSSSQWKKRLAAAIRSAMARVSGDGAWKCRRQGRVLQVVGRPEPAGAPEVHGRLERPARPASRAAPRGRSGRARRCRGRAARAGAPGRPGPRRGPSRPPSARPREKRVRPCQEAAQIGREPLLDEGLDGLGPRFLGEVDAVGVALVAALAVLPGHDRVVLELVEPGADEAVAALDLVVEEGEGQRPVHRLDPEREAAELHGQRIEVHAVDAALDDVAAQDRLQSRLEGVIVRAAGQRVPGRELLVVGRRTSMRARIAATDRARRRPSMRPWWCSEA